MDDPWDEHAKRLPTCGFLLATKDTDFINHVVSLHKILKLNFTKIKKSSIILLTPLTFIIKRFSEGEQIIELFLILVKFNF